jgi:hypothetical protein
LTDQLSAGPARAEVRNPVASDLLRGVRAISKEIGENERRTYYLLENKIIPAGKQGLFWMASRRGLREHYARLTGAGAA